MPTNVTIDSKSLMGQLGGTNTVFRLAYAEAFGTNVAASAGGRMLRDDRYKLIRFSDGHDEFYDLQTDPTELTNLNSSLTATQKQYRDRLQFWMYGYTTNSGVTVASPSWSAGQLSCAVTNAATNGSVVTLTDPAPLTDRAFYRVVK